MSEIYVGEYSAKQNCFNIATLEEATKTNLDALKDGRHLDYIPICYGSKDEVLNRLKDLEYLKRDESIEIDEDVVVPRSVSVDFDGVIAISDNYPAVDEDSIDVNFVEYLKDWQNQGGVVILNTARRRSNGTVQPALRALRKVCGFVPDYVNQNIKEGIKKFGDCRKIVADYFIDDRNITKEDFIDMVAKETGIHHLTISDSVCSQCPDSISSSYVFRDSNALLGVYDSNVSLVEENQFKSYTDDIAATLKQKNKAYGNSFDREMNEWGLPALCIRLSDKYSRLKNLIKNPNIDMGDESLYDTLRDLAGYSILGMNYLDHNVKGDSNE